MRFNQLGISMVQVTIAGAMLAGMSLVVMKQAEVQTKMSRRNAENMELATHMEVIKLELQNGDACKDTFENIPVEECAVYDANSNPPLPEMIFGTRKDSNEDPLPILQIGADINLPGLQSYYVSDMKLKDFNTVLKIAKLHVSYAKRNPASFGAAEITKQYIIRYQVNDEDEIIGCSSSMQEEANIKAMAKLACESDLSKYYDPSKGECISRWEVYEVGDRQSSNSNTILRCPSGMYVFKMRVRRDKNTDLIQLHCTEFALDGAPGNVQFAALQNGTEVTTITLGKEDNGTSMPMCDEGSVVKGFEIDRRDGTAVGSGDSGADFEFYCGDFNSEDRNTFVKKGPYGTGDTDSYNNEGMCGANAFLIGFRGKRSPEDSVHRDLTGICMRLNPIPDFPDEDETNSSCDTGTTGGTGGNGGDDGYDGSGEDGGGSGGDNDTCFVAGTAITLSNGETKAIEDISLEDKVMGLNGEEVKVLSLLSYELKGYKYSLNGSPYFVTENHPFKTIEGWKAFNPELAKKESPEIEVKKLDIGDVLLTEIGMEVLWSYDRVYSEEKVYNLNVDGASEYIADGYFVHNADKYDESLNN